MPTEVLGTKASMGRKSVPASLVFFSMEKVVPEVMNTLCLVAMSSRVELQIYNRGRKPLAEFQDLLLPIAISWQGYYLLNTGAAS